MRSKLLKQFCVSLLSSFCAASVYAAATVDPEAPHTRVSGPNGFQAVYYPSSNLDTTPATGYYVGNSFSVIDLTSSATDLRFTVSGVANNLWVFAKGTTAGVYYQVFLKSINGTVSTPSSFVYYGAGGATVSIGINPHDICSGPDGATTQGCSGGEIDDPAGSKPAGIHLSFVDSADILVTDLDSTERASGTKLELIPERNGPTLTHCPDLPGFFPEDSGIIVNTNDFTVTANATTGGSPNFTLVKVVASTGAITGTDYLNASIIENATLGSADTSVPGFTNSTNEAPVFYNVDYGIQDTAGVLAFCGQNPGGAAQAGYPLSNVFATDIQGFLRESNCFVATASFRNGRAPAVMMLRKFRDEILTKSEMGRDFIGWYYANGPVAADWLIENPIFRTFALAALIPLEVSAWVALHPRVLWIPFGFFCLLILGLSLRAGWSLRRRLLPGLFLVLASIIGSNSAHAADGASGASQQPYIDSLISELPQEAYKPSAGNPDPYLQNIKRGLAPDDTGKGYTDELKRQVTKDTSPGYTKQIQKGLAPQTGSAIEDYRKGKKLRANKGDLTTSSAFGFQIAATANRTFTAGENQDVAYEAVYGSGWIPDFKLHYEMRPFPRTSFISKFGLYGSAGTSFTKANGIFDFTNGGQFDGRSRTEFKFIMIPVNLGLIYRMNWGIFWPYIGAGPSAIGLIEQRNDNQPSQRGYSFGTWAMGGVALGLDWLSPSSSWDQYETARIKHSYFTIEYSYLTTLSGGIAEMTVDGVQVGFTFEL